MKETSALTIFVALIKALGAGEVITIILVFMIIISLGPVLAVLLVLRSNRELREKIQEEENASEKRFELLRKESEDRFLKQQRESEARFETMMKASEKRFESVVRMYEDNVLLVKNYERVADGLQTVIHISTQAVTQMLEKVNNNHFCPIVRERSLSDGH